ncbi:MAG: hypothetical protein NC397_04705 [Clostridium sp.]|nr:hypothetical protein [Clostridium sp.]
MKKKNFVALIMGTIGGLLFALGMCMCLLPEWNVFKPGVAVAVVGAGILVAMAIIVRKMSGKPAIKLNVKTIGTVAFGIISALVLGAGMCMIMVWNMMLWGIVVGIIGIVMILCLIPMCRGLK